MYEGMQRRLTCVATGGSIWKIYMKLLTRKWGESVLIWTWNSIGHLRTGLVCLYVHGVSPGTLYTHP